MSAFYTVGQSLGNGSTIVSDNMVTYPDGSTLETYKASNGTGPQTLILAKMLNCLCNLLLAEFGSTTGT